MLQPVTISNHARELKLTDQDCKLLTEMFSRCDLNPFCTWFTYDAETALCYLKDRRGYLVNRWEIFQDFHLKNISPGTGRRRTGSPRAQHSGPKVEDSHRSISVRYCALIG